MDKKKVDSYSKRLYGSYKDREKFMRVFNELKRRDVSRAEVVAIANKFAFETPASTTKKEALNRILTVHQNWHTMELKDLAMAGRSAA